ncbi:hypothetical protein HDF14_002333 [Edaphobacter lichenicola]|uniref:Uncharacterized protein n=1 Tax=Tunturiibacter gelidiferens TaxID=3069689 RepID=A0A9X0QED1_9BACT|nr:hypothetical protein [Edaphobacter lichenicola]
MTKGVDTGSIIFRTQELMDFSGLGKLTIAETM